MRQAALLATSCRLAWHVAASLTGASPSALCPFIPAQPTPPLAHSLQELEASHAAVCPSCPICKKSLGDYSAHWQDIDSRVAVLPVPPEYRGWRADILCNDCS